jgi:hypothetical protein
MKIQKNKAESILIESRISYDDHINPPENLQRSQEKGRDRNRDSKQLTRPNDLEE